MDSSLDMCNVIYCLNKKYVSGLDTHRRTTEGSKGQQGLSYKSS